MSANQFPDLHPLPAQPSTLRQEAQDIEQFKEPHGHPTVPHFATMDEARQLEPASNPIVSTWMPLYGLDNVMALVEGRVSALNNLEHALHSNLLMVENGAPMPFGEAFQASAKPWQQAGELLDWNEEEGRADWDFILKSIGQAYPNHHHADPTLKVYQALLGIEKQLFKTEYGRGSIQSKLHRTMETLYLLGMYQFVVTSGDAHIWSVAVVTRFPNGHHTLQTFSEDPECALEPTHVFFLHHEVDDIGGSQGWRPFVRRPDALRLEQTRADYRPLYPLHENAWPFLMQVPEATNNATNADHRDVDPSISDLYTHTLWAPDPRGNALGEVDLCEEAFENGMLDFQDETLVNKMIADINESLANEARGNTYLADNIVGAATAPTVAMPIVGAPVVAAPRVANDKANPRPAARTKGGRGSTKRCAKVNGHVARVPKLQHTANASDKFNGQNAAEILANANPDELVGELILIVAKHFSNKEICAALSEKLVGQGKLGFSNNNVWKRIKKALFIQAGEDHLRPSDPHPGYDAAKAALDLARQVNLAARASVSIAGTNANLPALRAVPNPPAPYPIANAQVAAQVAAHFNSSLPPTVGGSSAAGKKRKSSLQDSQLSGQINELSGDSNNPRDLRASSPIMCKRARTARTASQDPELESQANGLTGAHNEQKACLVTLPDAGSHSVNGGKKRKATSQDPDASDETNELTGDSSGLNNGILTLPAPRKRACSARVPSAEPELDSQTDEEKAQIAGPLDAGARSTGCGKKRKASSQDPDASGEASELTGDSHGPNSPALALPASRKRARSAP